MRNIKIIYKAIIPFSTLSTCTQSLSFVTNRISYNYYVREASTFTPSDYLRYNNKINKREKKHVNRNINISWQSSFLYCNKDHTQSQAQPQSQPIRKDYHASLIQKKEEFQQDLSLSKKIIQQLARQSSKSWKRLGPMIELASLSSAHSKNISTRRTAADIGCDHGLLTLALASLGKYDRLIGIDASYKALMSGAFVNHEKIVNNYPSSLLFDQLDVVVEFRVGHGLYNVSSGVHSIFIAGMGVHTMIDILFSSEGDEEDGSGVVMGVDRVGCNELFLQPASSKPRYLMELYEVLYNNGWVVQHELIHKVSNRWYISSSFHRTTNTNKTTAIPGTYLACSENQTQREEYVAYVAFHTKWLELDLERKGYLKDVDRRWLESDAVTSIPTI